MSGLNACEHIYKWWQKRVLRGMLGEQKIIHTVVVTYCVTRVKLAEDMSRQVMSQGFFLLCSGTQIQAHEAGDEGASNVITKCLSTKDVL